MPRPGSEKAERVAAYAHYDAPESAHIEDISGNAVITSEYVLPYLAGVKQAQRFCWWLSIDNSPVFRDERRAHGLWESAQQRHLQVSKYRTLAFARAAVRRLNGQDRLLHEVSHLTQSQYAWSYLYSKLDIISTMVSDYVPLAVLRSVEPLPIAERAFTIAYNPKKAARITELLKDRLPQATYLPLTGMTSCEIAKSLSSSMVYLDLGYHPGKDRMPREAAICGAVSLVARRGSGAFFEDVPIPWEHKISPNDNILNNSLTAINRVFENPKGNQTLQDPYRERIFREEQTFKDEVRNALVMGKFESNRA